MVSVMTNKSPSPSIPVARGLPDNSRGTVLESVFLSYQANGVLLLYTTALNTRGLTRKAPSDAPTVALSSNVIAPMLASPNTCASVRVSSIMADSVVAIPVRTVTNVVAITAAIQVKVTLSRIFHLSDRLFTYTSVGT